MGFYDRRVVQCARDERIPCTVVTLLLQCVFEILSYGGRRWDLLALKPLNNYTLYNCCVLAKSIGQNHGKETKGSWGIWELAKANSVQFWSF